MKLSGSQSYISKFSIDQFQFTRILLSVAVFTFSWIFWEIDKRIRWSHWIPTPHFWHVLMSEAIYVIDKRVRNKSQSNKSIRSAWFTESYFLVWHARQVGKHHKTISSWRYFDHFSNFELTTDRHLNLLSDDISKFCQQI